MHPIIQPVGLQLGWSWNSFLKPKINSMCAEYCCLIWFCFNCVFVFVWLNSFEALLLRLLKTQFCIIMHLFIFLKPVKCQTHSMTNFIGQLTQSVTCQEKLKAIKFMNGSKWQKTYCCHYRVATNTILRLWLRFFVRFFNLLFHQRNRPDQ